MSLRIVTRVARSLVCVIGAMMASQISAAERLPVSNCLVVSIAMNQDGTQAEDWSSYGVEFARVFHEHAKPVHRSVQVRMVLGPQATLPNIVAAFRWLATTAKKNDLAVVNIAAHGGTSRKDGWSTATMDGQSVYGRDLKLLASQLPCVVLFVIDTCGSGGFWQQHERDVPLPPNCVAFCSSRGGQSTTNVMNIALAEALWGQADADGDDIVELGETIEYVKARARRIAPRNKEAPVKEAEMPMLIVGEKVPADLKLLGDSKKLVAVLNSGEWLLARIDGETDANYKLHVMGAQDDPNSGFFVLNEAPKDQVFKLEAGTRPGFVTGDNRKRPALLLDRGGGKVKVRYAGAKRNREETVSADQFRSPFPAGEEPTTEPPPAAATDTATKPNAEPAADEGKRKGERRKAKAERKRANEES